AESAVSHRVGVHKTDHVERARLHRIINRMDDAMFGRIFKLMGLPRPRQHCDLESAAVFAGTGGFRMSSLRGIVAALVIAASSQALATEPWLSPVSSRSAAGVWEGLCQATENSGSYFFVIRMRIGQDGSGTVALGRWFGGNQPFMGQVLPIAKLDAAAGK